MALFLLPAGQESRPVSSRPCQSAHEDHCSLLHEPAESKVLEPLQKHPKVEGDSLDSRGNKPDWEVIMISNLFQEPRHSHSFVLQQKQQPTHIVFYN